MSGPEYQPGQWTALVTQDGLAPATRAATTTLIELDEALDAWLDENEVGTRCCSPAAR